jgi:hypothetical protein
MESFISQSFIDDKSICDELIEYHKNSAIKFPGQTSNGISPLEKVSTDVVILPNNNDVIIDKYLKELNKVCHKYIEQYKFCNEYYPFGISEAFNIQHYKPNEGYFDWHTERCTNVFPNNNRHLAFMTYLNDVDDKGETEFYYQKLKVKPKKGLTLIWAADWTHTHRGITSPTQEKYIITGWYSFLNKGN